jgi:hypothetical protein
MNRKIIHSYISNMEMNCLVGVIVMAASTTAMLITTQQAQAIDPQVKERLMEGLMKIQNKAAANNGQPDVCPEGMRSQLFCDAFHGGFIAATHPELYNNNNNN